MGFKVIIQSNNRFIIMLLYFYCPFLGNSAEHTGDYKKANRTGAKDRFVNHQMPQCGCVLPVFL